MTTKNLSAQERRQVSRAARDAFPPMGVYAVRGKAGAALRVYASPNVWGAINRLQFELRLGSHRDKELQSAWTQDSASFTFDVLEMVKERSDQAFDYKEELQLLEALHRSELLPGAAT